MNYGILYHIMKDNNRTFACILISNSFNFYRFNHHSADISAVFRPLNHEIIAIYLDILSIIAKFAVITA